MTELEAIKKIGQSIRLTRYFYFGLDGRFYFIH